jgi:hypothetical protein
MVIVPNVGQAPADVLFEARSLGRLVRFTRSAVHFDGGTSLEFVDAQVRTVRAEDQQQGVVHLLLGNDPMDWRTRIPTYSALVYEDAQPGVDVVFDTDERGLRATVRARNAAGSSRLAWRITRSSRLGQAVELAADLVAELATSLSQGAVAASGSPASAGPPAAACPMPSSRSSMPPARRCCGARIWAAIRSITARTSRWTRAATS